MSKNKPIDSHNHRVQIFFPQDSDFTRSRTIQSDKQGTDINYIMRNYQNTGVLLNTRNGKPFYGDFSQPFDYSDSLNAIREADAAFMKLPAKLRYRFNNDPSQLLEFVSNSSNRQEAIELGLIEPPVQEKSIVSENKNSQPSAEMGSKSPAN